MSPSIATAVPKASLAAASDARQLSLLDPVGAF